jgi:hypothetical protein
MIREKRTRKTGYNKPKSLSDKIRHCHDVSCNMIEREHRKPAITLPRTKHVTRWAPGFCKICGEHMDVITHSHAELHGYKRAEDLITAGMINFDRCGNGSD